MKDNLQIKQLKKKFKINNSSLSTIGLFFQKLDLKINISDGILNKESLIPPCIVFETLKKPKLRFLNENKFFKSYLIKIGKKNIEEMNSREYIDYIFASIKNGETREYKKWRKANKKKVIYLKSLVSEFNKKRKKPILELTEFEDGVARLDFGESDSVFNKRQKLNFLKKKKIFNDMLNELSLFSGFLKEKT